MPHRQSDEILEMLKSKPIQSCETHFDVNFSMYVVLNKREVEFSGSFYKCLIFTHIMPIKLHLLQ